MAGKLKEKLESFGIAFICFACSSSNAMQRIDGIVGAVLLLLSVRLAYDSLMHKLNARSTWTQANSVPKKAGAAPNGFVRPGPINQIPAETSESPVGSPTTQDLKFFVMKAVADGGEEDDDEGLIEISEDSKVDKVFTIGCFDLFHYGHRKLLKNMRRLGREVIAGIHDDRSIEQLKKRTPIDSTEKRMKNVSKYADQVFCISSTDPSVFFRCAAHIKKGETALFVRGSDMPNFPARDVAEELMSVRLLPYTAGVSSTLLRRQMTQSVSRSTSVSETED